ncbi:unnamed protein product [Echinostoma caproni]|uniref:Proline-, glutamic acid- and leucine-rich protein 1 n=1 Tax=Echinostoma caproni TaxID=27848 RepID=A0A183AHQ9_9TREM|nr:unnamed protein product [Echinostoma caproni]
MSMLQGLLLKALTTLVLITPYPRLKPGLLSGLLPGLHQLVHLSGTYNSLVDLRSGCLNLLGCILGRVPGPLLEVCQILSDNVLSSEQQTNPWSVTKPTSLSSAPQVPVSLSWSVQPTGRPRGSACWSGLQAQDPFQPCWLVQVCLRLIHPDVSTFAWDSTAQTSEPELPDIELATEQSPVTNSCLAVRQFQPPPVRIQALMVLRNMVPNYAAFLKPSLPLIKKTLLFCLQLYLFILHSYPDLSSFPSLPLSPFLFYTNPHASDFPFQLLGLQQKQTSVVTGPEIPPRVSSFSTKRSD